MEIEVIIRAIVSLVFVIGLMLGVLAVYKRFFLEKNVISGREKRMQVLEYLYLDRHRKLVIVKKDEEEITILIGAESEQIIK